LYFQDIGELGQWKWKKNRTWKKLKNKKPGQEEKKKPG